MTTSVTVQKKGTEVAPIRTTTIPINNAISNGKPSTQTEEETEDKDIDGGWAWVVLAATFMSMVILCGLTYNISIYFVAFLDHFNESKSYTSWVGALQNSVFHISGPLSSLILPYLGPRKILMMGAILLTLGHALIFRATSMLEVILTYGILSGVGSFFVVSGTLTSLSGYFHKKLYMVTGLMFSGGGLGIMGVGLLIESLIRAWGWRGSLLLLSGLSAQICICSALVFNKRCPNEKRPTERSPKTEKPSKGGSKNAEDEKMLELNGPKKKADLASNMASSFLSLNADEPEVVAKSQNKSFATDPCFWLLMGSMTLISSASMCAYIFFKSIVIQQGVEDSFQIMLSCVGIASCLGRLSTGVVATYVHPCLYSFLVSVVCCAAVLMFVISDTVWLFIVVSASFGFCHGTLAVLQSMTILHVFGKEHMSIIWGYAMGLGSVTLLAMPPICGYIADATQGYTATIILIALIFVCSGLCAIIVFFVHRKRQKRQERMDRMTTTAPQENGIKLESEEAEPCLAAA